MSKLRTLLIFATFWALQSCATPGPPRASDPVKAPTPVQVSTAPVLELVMVDVGQGDGMFMRTPDGRIMVVDTGFKGRGRALVSELRSRGIRKIDILVLSHPHADHIGGAIHFVDGFEVGEIWMSGAPSSTRVHRRLLEAIKEAEIPTKIVRSGDQRSLGSEVVLHVLAPEEPLLRGTRSDANANSVVLWVQHGSVDFLLTGDAEKETEQRVLEVLRARPPPDFEVLKVAHHGSRYASSTRFLTRVKPKLALISCGRRNRYRHPAPETIKRLEEIGATIFRTDLHGTFSVHSNGQKFWTRD